MRPVSGRGPTRASTLDALPAWTSPHVVVHVEALPEALARLGNSFLLDALLDAAPERDVLFEWLKAFPVESFSLVRGLMTEDEDAFQGAIRFASPLSGLDEGVIEAMQSEDSRTEALSKVFLDLFGIPEPLRGDVAALEASEPEEGETVYELDVELFGMVERTLWVSVGKDKETPVLLFGSTPEDVERARRALEGGKGRMKVVRRDARYKNFIQLNDDDTGRLTADVLEGLSLEAKAPVFAELSLGLSKGEIGLSLRHNVLNAFVGSDRLPVPTLSVSDPGLKFGGQETPWFTGLLSFALSEEDVLDLMAFIGDSERDEALAVLREQNIDPAALTEAFRSVGVVLGGASEFRGLAMPGGYAFLSGNAERMRSFLPLFRAFLEGELSHSFVSADRAGWDAFYTLTEEMAERLASPWAIGMKNGVFLVGCLSAETLDEALRWPDAGEGETFLLRAALDLERLYELFVPFLSSVSMEALEDFIDELELDGLLDLQTLSSLSRALVCLQEARTVALSAVDWGGADLSIVTKEANLKRVRELSRLSKKLSSASE